MESCVVLFAVDFLERSVSRITDCFDGKRDTRVGQILKFICIITELLMPGCVFNFLYDNALPLVLHIRWNECAAREK